MKVAILFAVSLAAIGADKRLTRLMEKMDQHGLAMMWLSMSVVLLEYDDVVKAAEGIAAEPKVARDTIPPRPPKFYELQDELSVRAKALAAAGKKKSDAEVGIAFARMTETCVACHSAFLKR